VYPVLEPLVVRYGFVKKTLGFFPEFVKTNTTTNKSLAEKNKELEVTIERLENELATKNALFKEGSPITFSAKMSSTTDVTEPVSFSTHELVMYPLMQDRMKLYSTILLSKGFKDGLEVGTIVYVRGLQAVCTIAEVYNGTSLCSLFTKADTTTEGVTSSSINLDLIGRGGYFIANVARDTPVSVGDTVYLKSDQSMTLGTVIQVANNNQDTSWHVFVRGAYNPVTSSIFYSKK
jgi:cell shape-determining protein MreC